ncbi:hypothetical protein [Halarchaeum acidiphilum]|uniref:hypothetical protein n=1 Tax=Halarchaeum acidiphilum TaxID=489138 RepID=UPI0011D20C10|nr:hypothetical protein [Halarchaeum acidiphilum]
MASEQGKTTHEFQGSKALNRAQGVLQSYDFDGQVDRIYVEIEETYAEEEEDTASQESSSQNKSKSSSKDERSFKEIRGDTNHHKVLYVLSKIDGEDLPASASDISAELDDVPDTSTFASLSDLYKRRLVDRKRVTSVDNPYHVYEISHYGKAELDRLGRPS